jgi:hypothetical protein
MNQEADMADDVLDEALDDEASGDPTPSSTVCFWSPFYRSVSAEIQFMGMIFLKLNGKI